MRPAHVTAKPQPRRASLSIQAGRRKKQPEVCDSKHILSSFPPSLPSTLCWAGAAEGTTLVIIAHVPDAVSGDLPASPPNALAS